MATRVPVRVDVPFHGGTTTSIPVDVAHLKRRLETTVEGEVRFDAGSKALYATDASNFRQVPIGVVIPRTLEDVVATHRACHEFGAPVLARGGGTSLSGETVNHAVVIDVSKYLHRIGEPDADTQTVLVEPGAINEHVNRRTGQAVGMVFGPDPSSHALLHHRGQRRQQLLRHPLRAGPAVRAGAAHVRQRRGARDRDLRRRALLGRRRRGGPARRHHRRGRAQGRDLRAAARPARQVRGRDPPRLPLGGRAAAPRVGLQPRRAAPRARLQRRAGARRDREHVRDGAAGAAEADAGPVPPPSGDRAVPRPSRGDLALHGDHRALAPDRARGPGPPPHRGPAGRAQERLRHRRAATVRRAGLRVAARAVRRRQRRRGARPRRRVRGLATRSRPRRRPDRDPRRRPGRRRERRGVADPRGRPRRHRLPSRRA